MQYCSDELITETASKKNTNKKCEIILKLFSCISILIKYRERERKRERGSSIKIKITLQLRVHVQTSKLNTCEC